MQVGRLIVCTDCREAQKEMELLEKKLERTEKARAQEVSVVIHVHILCSPLNFVHTHAVCVSVQLMLHWLDGRLQA